MTSQSTRTLTSLPLGDQVFLIELDALLDTRLAVAGTLHEDAWKEIACHPGYHKRKTDDLSEFTERFTKEEFDQAWKERDKSCLKHALVTNYVRVLAQTSADLHRDLVNKNNPHVQKVEFCINVHPYLLSKEEKDEIENAVLHYLMPGCTVRTCRLPYPTLNFAYLRAHYSTVVMYNFRDWMEVCEPEGYDGPGAPQVTVMAPALYGPEGKPSVEDIKQGLNVEGDVDDDVLFGLSEYTMSYLMTLALQDPGMFSVVQPEEK